MSATAETRIRNGPAIPRLLAVVGDEWVCAKDIARLMGISIKRAHQIVSSLPPDAQLEKRRARVKDRWNVQYRRAREGYVAPLYETELDAWPLARAMGGYTFKGATPCQV